MRVSAALAAVIPGGAHTYAKGDDQFPEGLAPIIAYGRGAHVWDVDGNKYLEYGSGLRAVALGHAHPRVNAAVHHQVDLGQNFTRPAAIELDAAEAFLRVIDGAEMVKFAKNGSDATTAAVRLARAATGRDLVALSQDHPFFSTDDWFIGTTALSAGIPVAVRNLTVGFPYNDLGAAEALFTRHPGQIACLILEAAATAEPADGYLAGLRALCDRYGSVLILDEMITGFRWANSGAQHVYGVRPHLSTFGKALGNGYAIAALTGDRDLLSLGGIDTDRDRVFLLSTTHGAETHSLAAMLAVLGVYREEDVIGRLYSLGQRLADGVKEVAARAGVEQYVSTLGRPCNLVYVTCGPDGQRSQEYRTLFLGELIRQGILAPSLVVSAALTESDIDQTIAAVANACNVYAAALEHGVARYLTGRAVKPVFRRYA